jgi:hypothetical protein
VHNLGGRDRLVVATFVEHVSRSCRTGLPGMSRRRLGRLQCEPQVRATVHERVRTFTTTTEIQTDEIETERARRQR